AVSIYFYAHPSLGEGSHPAALINAIVSSCSGDPEVCTLTLHNAGNADTSTTSTCSLTSSGTNHTAKSTLATIKAGESVTVTCTASSGTAPNGSQVSGSVIIATGAEVVFTGNAS